MNGSRMNQNRDFKCFTWNVRGLNDREKRVRVRKHIAMHHPHLVTLKETKIAHMNVQILKQTVGATYDAYLHNEPFFFLRSLLDNKIFKKKECIFFISVIVLELF
jgi:hypothetical protein